VSAGKEKGILTSFGREKLFSSTGMAPCILFEDEHLLVVNKPAGWNTHAPAPHAGEGIYDWLRHREPRWASLAIIHRLDKETSGVLVFAKTPLANRSLTEQFTLRQVKKRYHLLTDREAPARELTVKTTLARRGEKYASGPGGESAETVFTPAKSEASPLPGTRLVVATPLTGRTHQIRVHAAESGFPILGDVLYGGTPAARVYLHAADITFSHPATGKMITYSVPANFAADARQQLRTAVVETTKTNAYRMIQGASDGWPGWYVERLGDYLLSQSGQALSAEQSAELAKLTQAVGARGSYHKSLSREVRRSNVAQASPRLSAGEAAPATFEILENGVRYEMSFNEGYSVGLFLDQRDNRRRLSTGHVAADFELPAPTESGAREMLNCFAYTCGFSVCGAQAGWRATSLDLSKKYLDWGRRNFALNGLDPAQHDFIFGDTFDWLRRLAKKGRSYELVILDPPTFSQSKESGTFRAEKDYGKLLAAALRVTKPGGVVLASANTATWAAEDFLTTVTATVRAAGRKILKSHYVPQPPDFPISRDEPAYLKTVWLRVT
jgi:23S rRNA (cytosine1962-C5)-methyltransferase